MERVASQNINEDKTKVECEEKLLKGMPAHLIQTLEKVPGKDGFRFVSMKKPEINPALKLVEDEDTRKRLSLAMGNKAVPANSHIVEDIVAKRHEMALLLGHSSYSQYTLMKKMAKNPMNVQKFEEDLTKLIIKKGHEEKQEMIDFKRKHTGDQNTTIHNWDGSYYGNLFLQKNYQIETEKIREFFPMENVIAQTLDIYQELLGLQFSKLKDASTWHSEVQAYQVSDKKSGDVMGQFYLDLFPRENKYGHAAAFPL
jgi:thimet oligopeptidase